MDLKVDTSEIEFFLKAVKINVKKIVDKSIDSYNSLFQIHPEHVREIHEELGDELEKKGNYGGAINAYNKILSTDPNNVSVLLKQAKIFIHLGQLTVAEETLNKVTAIDDNNIPEAFYLLGSVKFSLDANKDALKALKKATDLNPGYADAYYKLGLVHDAMHNTDAAIEAYLKTIGLKPAFVKPYQSLGFAYEAKGNRDEAVKYFKKSMELDAKKS